nr:phage tail tape measure protein [uncultured Romboutsia sp.]
MSVNLGTAVGYLELDSSRWTSSYNTARQQMQTLADSSQSMGSRFQAAGAMLTSAGTTLTTHVTLPLAAIGTASIKTAADFESSMSNVQALSGATGSELEQLSNLAKEMGANTQFSASEAADALGYMALAGWDTQQSMNALPGVLNLAAASGMGLAEASDLVTDYLSAFGEEADQAGRMADVLSYAQANSNTTTAGLGEAFKNCAANANAFGLDIEQTTALIGKLSDQGLKGSEAGTALSAVFRDITQKMKDGNITIGKTKIAVQDANGNYRSMTDILRDVENATDGMGDAQKNAALMSTFTSDSLKALNILLQTGSGNIEDFEKELRNSSGTAEEMANIMNDNLNGQITALKSALEGAAIAIGEALLPMIKGLVSVLQGALNWFNGLNDGVKTTIVTVGLVVAAIGPLLLILGSLASAIGNLIELKALLAESSILSSAIGRVSGLFTSLRNIIMGSVVPAIQSLWAFMLANPITFVIAAIAALVAGFVYLWNNCESFRNFWIDLWDNIVSTVSKIPGQVQKIFNELPGKISGALDSVGDTLITWGYSISGGVGDTMTDLYGVFRDSFDGMVEYIKNITTIVKDIFTGNWGAIPGDVEKLFTGMCNSVGNILSGLANIVGDAFAMVNDAIQAVLGKIWGGVIDWASNINSGLGQAFLNAYYTISDTFDGIMTVIRDVTTIISDIFRGDWSSAVNHLKTLWNDLLFYAKMIFGDIVESIKGFIVGAKDFVVDGVSNIGKSISNWASDTYNTISNWASNTISAVGQWFNELPSKIGYALGFALGVIAGWVVNTWNYFATNIPLWIESIGTWFSELPGRIGQWLTDTYNNVISWGSNMLSKAIETGTNFVNNVVNFIKNLPATVSNWLTQTYNKAVNWATQMLNKAREAGSNFVSKVGSTIQSLPGRVWNFFSQTISRAATFVSQFGQKATQAARNFTTNIVNGVRNIPNQMLSIGRNIVQGIWRGISGAAGWLRSQISNFASGIINGFKSAFKINSPSKIMRDVIGKGIVEGIGVGMDQEEGSLLTQANKLAGNVVDIMSGNIATNNLFDTAKSLNASMDIATSQATGQDSKINKFDSLLHVENLTINDDKDVETLANDIAFYLKRKNILTV